MMQSYRGYKIYWAGEDEFFRDIWKYADNNEVVEYSYNKRPCGYCGRHNTENDHDACIANLPGVRNACCGHGEIKDCYVQFDIDNAIYGQEAYDWQMSNGRKNYGR